MFFWRRVAPQVPEDTLKLTATPGYTRNIRDLNDLLSRGKSFSGYERNLLFLNRQGHGFTDVGGLLGVDFDDDARAVASMDWDRDGDLDLWVTNRTAPRVRLLKNNHPSTNSFVAVRLIGNGKTTNRDAIGARLTLTSTSERAQIRTIRAGDGFLAQSSAWVHFGLGQETDSLSLRVSWPGGDTETFSGLKAGQRYTITQGESQPRADSLAALAKIPEPRQGRPQVPVSSGFWVANQVPFPELAFTDSQGTTISTAKFLGQPVLINLWATWCVPCMEELSVFAKHADALRAQGATVLALNVDQLAVEGKADSAAHPEAVLARLGYGLPHGVARQEHLAKIEILIEYLSSRRAPLTIPSSFLVDAKGNVASVYLQPVDWEQLAGDLALLNSTPTAQLKRASPRPGRWLVDPRQVVDRAAYLGDYATLFAKNGFPDESQRLYQMIAARGTQGEVAEARATYNQAKLAAQQGQAEKAMQLYRRAIRLDPEYGPAYTGLGALLLMQKQVDQAQVLFQKALDIDPDHATALMNLAMIDRSRGDNQRALERLRQVIARNPGYAQAQLNLGSLLASMKRHDEAIEHLSQAIQIDPKLIPAHMNLAVVYTQTEQWAKAEDHYRRVEELNPRMSGYVHVGLGTVQARQQRHVDAVASYRTAIARGVKNAQTYTQLGLSLLALGEDQAAVDAFHNALQLDPNYEAAKRAIQEHRQ